MNKLCMPGDTELSACLDSLKSEVDDAVANEASLSALRQELLTQEHELAKLKVSEQDQHKAVQDAKKMHSELEASESAKFNDLHSEYL